MGAARMAPGVPHIQNQKINDRTTRTGFKVKRRAKSIGVGVSSSPRQGGARVKAPLAAHRMSRLGSRRGDFDADHGGTRFAWGSTSLTGEGDEKK